MREKLKDHELILESKENKIQELLEEIQRADGTNLQTSVLQEEIVFWQKKYNELETLHCEEITKIRDSYYKKGLQEYESEKRTFLQQIEEISRNYKELNSELEQMKEKNSKLHQEKAYFEAKSKEFEQRVNIIMIECDEWREKSKEIEKKASKLEGNANYSIQSLSEDLKAKEKALEEIKRRMSIF